MNPVTPSPKDLPEDKNEKATPDATGPAGGGDLTSAEVSNGVKLVHGFELVREETVAELNGAAKLYRHVKSGAELLSIECDDDNKCFTAAFRTPPPDSSGLTHILEHSVLEGSEKYPLKDLFKQISKSSIKTYLNASTGSDRTYYPAASQNLKDFHNLVQVYLDAVFHPLLTHETFRQEGWHYDLDNPADPLTYKGVVFNEMKGAAASPTRTLYVKCKEALFPDTPYRHDAGGDPSAIPTLTYQAFKDYHAKYYHPSNARLYFYGNDDPEMRLKLADEALRDFDARPVDSQLPLQAPFDAPRELVASYAVSEGTDLSRRSFVTANWALPERGDSETVMALDILNDVLMGNPAAPLRKALIESGLGDGLAAHGLRGGQRQLWFSVGLKGAASDSGPAIGDLVERVLTDLSKNGVDKDLVRAAVNAYEFQLRESDPGAYPQGIYYMGRILSDWLYDRDPIEALRYEQSLASIRKRLDAGEPIFERLIEEYFLNNNHRACVILEPDPQLQAREKEQERQSLENARASLDEAALAKVAADAKALKEYQKTPDPEEALNSLPRLALSDLDRLHKPLPIREETRRDTTVLFHDLFTNGLAYVHVGFNLRTLPADLIPYVPIFAACLKRMDTEREDFVKIARRIDTDTGGIWPAIENFAVRGSSEPASWLFLRGKATADKGPEMFGIMGDILFSGKLDNQSRFLEVLRERKARLEDQLIPEGSSVVSDRIDSHFHAAGRLSEQMSGVDHLAFLKRLIDRAGNDWPGVLSDLERLRAHLLNRDGMLCNVTTDEESWKRFGPSLDEFLDRFPNRPESVTRSDSAVPALNEGLTVPAQVNYVCMGANLYDLGYQYDGSIMATRELINSAWLWDKVRVQGGAYGSRVGFDRNTGVLSFVSWRDPNLLATLDVYGGTAEFLRNAEISPEQLKQAIIGAAGKLDPCMLPDRKGTVSMLRYLSHVTDESSQLSRDQLLAASVEDMRRFAEVLEKAKQSAHVVVMGGKAAIDEADRARNGWLAIQKLV